MKKHFDRFSIIEIAQLERFGFQFPSGLKRTAVRGLKRTPHEKMTEMDVDTVFQDSRDSDNPAFHAPMQVMLKSIDSLFPNSICSDGKIHQLLKPAHDHESLVLVHETLKALARVSDPISVVTGVGTQRLGKSTLLNLFHSRVTAGFGLGHSLDAQVQFAFAFQ